MLIPVFLSAIGVLSVPFWMHLTTTSPTPLTPKENRRENDLSPFTNISLKLLQLCLWAHAVAESLSILSSAGILPASFSTYLLLAEGHFAYLTSARVVSGLAVVLGGILRQMCFREMGAQFTIHITVLPGHKLVTSGPYAYVRHPAYSGALLVNCGLWPWLFLPGSWVTQSSVAESVWFWLTLVPCVVLAAISVPIIFRRCDVEDEILKKQFGKEWEKWVKDVPYRLFPGLY